jgi:hypothetical protein
MGMTWRVYCRQWLPFHTSVMHGPAGGAECEAAFRAKYDGKVEDGDWRVDTPGEAYGRSFLMLQVPNCCGEFTGEAAAAGRAGEHGHEGHPHEIVLADSPEERKLQAYGTRRLQ